MIPDFWEYIREHHNFSLVSDDRMYMLHLHRHGESTERSIERWHFQLREIGIENACESRGFFMFDIPNRMVLLQVSRDMHFDCFDVDFDGMMEPFFTDYSHRPKLPSLYELIIPPQEVDVSSFGLDRRWKVIQN